MTSGRRLELMTSLCRSDLIHRSHRIFPHAENGRLSRGLPFTIPVLVRFDCPRHAIG